MKRLAAILWALLLSSLPAVAEVTAPQSAAPDEWQFIVTPYVWGLEVVGDVEAKGHRADVHASFSDILEDLNAALMGTVEAQNGRLVLLFDGLGAWLEDDVDVGAKTVSVPSFPLVTATIGPSKADVKVTLAIIDLKAGWRVLSVPTVSLLGETPADEDTRRFDVDLFAGGRYWYEKTELDLKVPVSLGIALPPGTPLPPGLGDLELPSLTTDGIDRDIDADTDWIDPLVGLRFGVDLTEKISLSVAGDLGGFDIGSASKFTWAANALFNWQLSESWALVAGYQALNLQRDKGDAEADLTLKGPVVGLAYRFLACGPPEVAQVLAGVVVEAEVALRDAALRVDQERHHHVLELAIRLEHGADSVAAEHGVHLVGRPRQEGPAREVGAARGGVFAEARGRVPHRVQADRGEPDARAQRLGQLPLHADVHARQDRARPRAARVHEVQQHGLAAQRFQGARSPVLIDEREGGRRILLGRHRGETAHRPSAGGAGLRRPELLDRHDAVVRAVHGQVEAHAVSGSEARQQLGLRDVEVHRHRRHQALDLVVVEHELAELGAQLLHGAGAAVEPRAAGEAQRDGEREGDSPHGVAGTGAGAGVAADAGTISSSSSSKRSGAPGRMRPGMPRSP